MSASKAERAARGIGAEIRAAREAAGLTQDGLAVLMGVSQQAVAKLEGRRSNPSVKTLMRMSEALGLTVVFSFTPRGT